MGCEFMKGSAGKYLSWGCLVVFRWSEDPVTVILSLRAYPVITYVLGTLVETWKAELS